MPRTKPRSVRRHTRALKQGALLSLALGEIACSPAGAPPPPEKPTSVVTLPAPASAAPSAGPTPADEARDAIERLLPYVVLHDKPARRTLYTWTTRAQIEELEKNRTLLTRTESPEHGASYFDQVLDARARAKDALAQALRTSAFARARYAWPAPWATFLGFPGETYGNELIEITLKPEAWFVVFRTSQPAMTVVDMDNRPVVTADALAHPERIAAVYFLHDTPTTGYAASTAGPEERSAYREYVVCNESMIESFAVRTTEIGQEIARSADAVEAIGMYLREHRASTLLAAIWNLAVLKETWTLSEPAKTAQGVYEGALAFPNENYLPAGDPLIALAGQLRALKLAGPPIVHRPTAVFPAPSAIKPVPAPRVPSRPTRRGTY